MTTLVFILSPLVLLSCGFFIYALWTYIVARKKAKESMAAEDVKSEAIANSDDKASEQNNEQKFESILAILQQQQAIVSELRRTTSDEDQLHHSLFDCWQLFLELEAKLVVKQVTNEEVDQRLEKFIPLTQDAGFSQRMESLVKKISAQRNLTQAINRDIARKNQLVLAKMGVNNELNSKLEYMQTSLQSEPDVDAKLAKIRMQLVQVYQLESAVRAKLLTLKEAPDKVSEDYQLALELFLDSSDLDDFMAPLQDEFDNKIEELKSIAEYQANTINELKRVVKEASEQTQVEKYKIDYDIVVARLEKSLSDKEHLLSRLELKLDSLQMVKYQLSKDIQAKDRLVLEHDEELQQIKLASDGEFMNIQQLFLQKEESLNKMTSQLDSAPLTQEFQVYAAELDEKITAFKLMMSESELFVEMLEFELESEQKRSAEFQTRLAELSEYVMQQSQRVESIDKQDSNKLEEANKELALEIATMKKEFERSLNLSDESTSLRRDIAQLDDKISALKAHYAEMEDKFLSSLL